MIKLMSVLFFSFVTFNSYAQVVITEIMPNPATNGTINEFVELFNTSFTDSVDLSSYSLKDNNTFSNFIFQRGKPKIGPRRFALVLDSDYFLPSNSLLTDYVLLIPDSVSLFKTSNSSIGNSLGNTADSVKLYSQQGGTGILISQIAWSSTTVGKSWEKKFSDVLPIDKIPSSNWGLSLTNKGTPGFLNSISPLDYDVALTLFSVANDQITSTDSIAFSARIKNKGTQNLNSITFSVFADTSLDGNFQLNEKFSETPVQNLDAGDSITIIKKFKPGKVGTYLIKGFVKVANDQNPQNDSATIQIKVTPVFLKDISVQTFSVLPKSVGERKDTAVFNLLLKNKGIQNTGFFQVELLNGNTVIFQKNITDMIPGDTLRIKPELTFQQVGDSKITAKANLIGDENNLNDTLSTTLTVTRFNNKNAIILSEIMFNADGTESQNEFIEIYNTSETDTVDLTGFKIKDGSATVSTLASHNHGLKLLPQNYAVVHPPSYFLQPNLFYLSEDTSKSLPLSVSTSALGNGLTNTGEIISLISNVGDTLESFTLSDDLGNGFSAEKIDLEIKNDNSNWIKTVSINGTPGKVNSQNLFDINASLSATSSAAVFPGQFPHVPVSISNKGKGIITQASLVVYEDIDLDNIVDSPDSIFSIQLTNLSIENGNSVNINLTTDIIYTEPLNWIVYLRVPDDEVLSDNKIVIRLNIANKKNTLQISEIMFNPITDKTDGLLNQPEYVELYNPNDFKVFMKNWEIGDRIDEEGNSNTYKITDSVYVYPNSFFVISSDSSLLNFWPNLNADDTTSQFTILNKSDLHLNADEDAVIIYDLFGAIIDSVFYSDNWHNPEYPSTKGISLERRSFLASSNDPFNWGSSAARPSGGTPGKVNSVAILKSGKQSSTVEFSTNPFSPDNDGFEDVCSISYSLKGNIVFVQARIFDRLGRSIRTLQNYSISGSSGVFIWDGKRDDGSFVLMGPYIVYIEGMNATNCVVEAVKKVVVVAKKL